MTRVKRVRLPSIKCPHCGSRAVVRDSQPVTPTVRELRNVCDNDECGCTFVTQLSVIRIVRPSARPNPEVHVPLGRWTRRPANDDHPDPANDDHGLGVAIGAAMTT